MVKYESIYSFFACPKNESRKDTSVKEKLFYNQENIKTHFVQTVDIFKIFFLISFTLLFEWGWETAAGRYRCYRVKEVSSQVDKALSEDIN